jgi:glycosyltransferase involved in cell wall biosynthesis
VSGRIWCAIPVYNNRATLRTVVEGCLHVIPGNVIVVDDGSTDADIEELVSGLNVTTLRHEKNLGKGAAILTASRYIEEQGGAHMITIDADGQHDPADMARFIPLLAGNDDILIVGSRDFSGSRNVPAASRFGRRFANFWLKVEAGVSVSDCQSGFRSYPVRHINRLRFRGVRYDFEAEVLARAAWAGLEIKDVEISVSYPPPEERVSHFKPFFDNFMLTHRHILLILRRLMPWPQRKLVKRERLDYKLLLHPSKVMQMLLREHSTPGGLAVAAAAGVFLGAVPLLFVHSLVILYVSARLNLNKLMALNTQHICMPPVVPAICIELGYYMRNGVWLTDLSFETIFVQFGHRLFEWFLGSLIVGPALGAIIGAIVYMAAVFIRNRRTVADG